MPLELATHDPVDAGHALKVRWRALVLGLAIALVAVLNAGYQIWADYHEAMQRHEVIARDIVRVVDAHVHGSMHQADIILDMVADVIRADRGPQRMTEPERWKLLNTHCRGLSGCRYLQVVTPQGMAVAVSSRREAVKVSVADRAYFQAARTSSALYISEAVVSRAPGNEILFFVAKPVRDAQGQLLAVLAVGMSTAHLAEFYGLMGFQVSPTVTVFRSDGDLVARHPDMRGHVGKNNAKGPLFTQQLPKAPSGVYRSHSVLDGRDRIAAYQSVPKYGLVIFAGIELDQALRAWRGRAWRTVLTTGAALLVMALLVAWGYRSTRRVLSLKDHNRELDQLTQRDALTEIANRRYFDIVMGREAERMRNDDKPLSLMMVDVDYFKLFNDAYGHQAGDVCLRQVAAALNGALHREVDLVARYGGEEFAVILHADDQGALLVAERMRARVEALAIPHAQSKVASVVTVSIGVTTWSRAGEQSLTGLLHRADEALYRAKQQGRNRVQVL